MSQGNALKKLDVFATRLGEADRFSRALVIEPNYLRAGGILPSTTALVGAPSGFPNRVRQIESFDRVASSSVA
jgi:hypothetical protein